MATLEEYVSALPHASGVYLYKDQHGTILYVGKAIDLAKRVSQYFKRDDAIGNKTQQLVSQIATIETIQTATEFDALLLEAKLIRAHKPKYNSIAKDDKSPLYIAITSSEELPHIYFLRGGDLGARIFRKKDVIFGPFQSARVARMILQNLRHGVTFCLQNRRSGKPCFYTHIGLCNPCPSFICGLSDGDQRKALTHEYRKHIFRIVHILSGQVPQVLHDMEKEMQLLAKAEKFEQAAIIKKQIDTLYLLYTRRYDVSLYTDKTQGLMQVGNDQTEDLRRALSQFFPDIGPLLRIECIDISNTGGTFATGSLVVLSEGVIDPGEYKRFRIRRENVPNDVAMIAEVLRRRLGHPEWESPDLLVIDGGKTQLASASLVLSETGKTIPIVGLAKRREEIIIQQNKNFQTLRLPLTSSALHLLERIRDEAHRFALKYHRHLRTSASFSPAKAS